MAVGSNVNNLETVVEERSQMSVGENKENFFALHHSPLPYMIFVPSRIALLLIHLLKLHLICRVAILGNGMGFHCDTQACLKLS